LELEDAWLCGGIDRGGGGNRRESEEDLEGLGESIIGIP